MDVRVWGVVEDRLIELRVEPGVTDLGIRIEGLPDDRTRTTGDRVRSALLNCGLVREAPAVTIRLEPPVRGRTTSELDLALVLAVLARVGVIGAGLRWVLATGRLGLDGAVYARGVAERPAMLADVVGSLCQTPVLGFEHMFETWAR
ncbi:MAG: hypothetical protein HY240_02550 [Actinobacteria bacterium]|nr:hypothetical protein [Actinomycetota bacterium]